jgi:hypothetical protein
MKMSSKITLTIAQIFFVYITITNRAVALDYQISNPDIHDNLAVYFVRGGESEQSTILSLDQAAMAGAVQVYQQRPVNGPVAVKNLSNQSIFIQLGDLLKGGLQDQVVGRSLLLLPGSGRVSIDTFCVDPFRATARDREDGEFFSATGAMFPWRLAKLNALVANPGSVGVPTPDRDVRQLGIWWSIDSLRFKLAQNLGVPLEPAKSAHWSEVENVRVNTVLAARHSKWKTSLPLSLENPELNDAQQAYIDGLGANGEYVGRIIGAIFVINGRIEAAEIYHSPTLFQQMWPKLVHAYATEAIALSDVESAPLPTILDLREFLAAAEQGKARDLGSDSTIRESDAAIFTSTVDRNGSWIYRSYLPKYSSDRQTPEGAILNVLESGKVSGRLITSLDPNELVVLRSDPFGGYFAAVESAPESYRSGALGDYRSDVLGDFGGLLGYCSPMSLS